MRIVLRVLAGLAGLSLLAAGVVGLLTSHAPQAEATFWAGVLVERGLSLFELLALALDPSRVDAWLASAVVRFALPPVGLLLLVAAFLPATHAEAEELSGAAGADADAAPMTRRARRRTRRQAGALARKGDPRDAGELLFQSGDLDRAVEVFVAAAEFARAAEVRHDQNRFIECAELYAQAGQLESAGRIFGQQEEWLRSAECYQQADRQSVAGEMFEKAGDHRRAGDCYRAVDFLRHAAQSYVRCHDWKAAAECLEGVCAEESSRPGGADPAKLQELERLVRQAGALFERAGDLPRAQAVLERGGCPAEAAELALRLEHFSRAAELFADAGKPTRAADALRLLGEESEAERILGEYHRGRGECKQAAEHFEQAGEFASAGDLFRQLEEFEQAGACFARCREDAQAAEMYQLAGDRERASACYERAGLFREAAECVAQLDDVERVAGLLEKAEDCLGAGELYHREGLDDDAIRVLQQVAKSSESFSSAAALLGDIFSARGQFALAIQKLEQAVEQGDLSRESVGLHYSLASVCESQGDVDRAVEVYEKILSFDYHYKDVEQRLLQARELQKRLGSIDPSRREGESSRALSQGGTPGRYQVVGELGRGGMGIVYKAKDTVLDRVVAYKVLPDALKENPQALKNFLREAKAAAKLNHPNIVTVYDAGEQDGRYYIAMEYVDGTTLKEILRRRGVIAPASIFHVLGQICEALAYAHDKKVVHRDIKTANAMWTRDKKAKIMDFGLAKVVEEVRNHTTVVSGTPYYMSPEQTLGKNVDHRTDIYSLGVTVFELATGTVPFREGNIPYHHVHTPPPDIRELRPDAPESLAAIVSRCLQKDPDARYPATREILADVRKALAAS